MRISTMRTESVSEILLGPVADTMSESRKAAKH
jgi:hypothetical protein